ncbi:acid protease [Punctularia strigosozonata HHB-11173 SS5]|uniref:acid protease n=1 Tax=Punctularia strigosozonata (strain HHB-11173) TaxID=741275 RepID=UPI0004417B99|nr:acid protease [Punctularia strigosozonata HHB-11173 SS5]EIN11518.1 acid protease [Punctularia strigosozonata HHB-11173 SS5]
MKHTTAASLLALASFQLAQASPFHPSSLSTATTIPVVRRRASTRALTPDQIGAAGDRLRAKYGRPTVVSKRKRAGQTVGVSITNEGHDASYVAQVSVGTPAKDFLVVLDTGSSDFWLASTGCQACVSTAAQYDSSQSSSFKASSGFNSQVQIPYGSGAVQGDLGSENVNLGGFSVAGQTFLVVDQITNNFFSGETDVSGIMGLAFQSIAATKATPFWQTLVSNNQLDQPMMSFWLQRASGSSSNDQPGGVLTFGGVNTTLFSGDIEYNNQPSDETASFWLLDLQKVTVTGKEVQLSGGNNALSAIDTGTTLIGGPSTDVANFWATVPGSEALTGSNQGFWSYPCSMQLNATLNFGGRDWPISDEDMQFQQLDRQGTLCAGAIFDLDANTDIPVGSGTPAWIVGDTFLKNVYTVFRASNPPAVGFAELSTAAGGTGTSPGTQPPSVSASVPAATASSATSSTPSSGSSGSTTSGATTTRASTGLMASALLVLASCMFVMS